MGCVSLVCVTLDCVSLDCVSLVRCFLRFFGWKLGVLGLGVLIVQNISFFVLFGVCSLGEVEALGNVSLRIVSLGWCFSDVYC